MFVRFNFLDGRICRKLILLYTSDQVPMCHFTTQTLFIIPVLGAEGWRRAPKQNCERG